MQEGENVFETLQRLALCPATCRICNHRWQQAVLVHEPAGDWSCPRCGFSAGDVESAHAGPENYAE